GRIEIRHANRHRALRPVKGLSKRNGDEDEILRYRQRLKATGCGKIPRRTAAAKTGIENRGRIAAALKRYVTQASDCFQQPRRRAGIAERRSSKANRSCTPAPGCAGRAWTPPAAALRCA